MTQDNAERVAHRIRWFGVVPGGEKVPRNGSMNGRDWGWDVECSCGWATHTGGAIQERIKDEIHWHRREVQHNDGLIVEEDS